MDAARFPALSGEALDGTPFVSPRDLAAGRMVALIGFALDHWLFYATGGGIGVNYDTRIDDPDFTGTHKKEFDWGWTVGGGIERMIGCHWSIKAEYLYYKLDDQTFDGTAFGSTFRWAAETEGHIVRGGLNYKF